ncbi:MAG: flagellar M-ring protein FliF [Synergistaceae bacterium]|nr:flagellar M-ring protein FliF [Synergistaceae bacterium]
MENLRQLRSRFLSFWASLKLWQRVSVFAAAFLVLSLLILAVVWSRRTSYEPLFVRLDMEDQAAIVSYLRENRVPYQLNPVAGAILVPKEQVHEARLALAQEGIPKGAGRGFELFDDNRMGSSEFDKQVAYIRAVEGELQRTISQMDVVDSARVRIVVPRPQLFLERREPSQASVLVRLKSGARLNPNQVKAIVFLVSRSVEGLQPEGVTVVDTSGRVLSDMISDDWLIYSVDGQSGVTSVQRQLERQLESELINKVRIMLERVFGVGSVQAEVKVELDFDKKESSLREFFPDPETGQGVIRSRESEEEDYEGTGANIPNAPGTTTNIPGYDINRGQNVQSTYNRARNTQNMEITTRQTNETATPGTIKRLTASVVVNRELNESELLNIRNLTAAAIGYNEVRGDSIVVNAMKFDDSFARELLEELRKERLARLVAGIFIAVLALVGAVLVIAWWQRRRRARLALSGISDESKRIPTIQEMLTSPDLLAFQGEMAVLEEQLKAYARNNPGEVANLINEWISSD